MQLQSLVEAASITGPSTKSAFAYGCSYGFGNGDHAKGAELITKHFGNDMDVSYDQYGNLEGLTELRVLQFFSRRRLLL